MIDCGLEWRQFEGCGTEFSREISPGLFDRENDRMCLIEKD